VSITLKLSVDVLLVHLLRPKAVKLDVLVDGGNREAKLVRDFLLGPSGVEKKVDGLSPIFDSNVSRRNAVLLCDLLDSLTGNAVLLSQVTLRVSGLDLLDDFCVALVISRIWHCCSFD
jgi:hypothetical protein